MRKSTKISYYMGIMVSLILGFSFYSISLDVTIDNTVGYIKDMYYTKDGNSQTLSPSNVQIKGASGDLDLEGNLMLGEGKIKDRTILGEDIGNAQITTNKILDKAVTNIILGDGAVTTEKIKDSQVDGTKVKDSTIKPENLDKAQQYTFSKIESSQTVGYQLDANGTSKLNSVYTTIGTIDEGKATNQLLIGTNPIGAKTVQVDGKIQANGTVCKQSFCIGQKPNEIGAMEKGKWCAAQGGKIECNATIESLLTYSWETSAWSACSKTCGGGTQTRTVVCKSSIGTIVADSKCTTPKPTTSQSCNTQSCEVKIIIAQNLSYSNSGKWTKTLQGSPVNLNGFNSGYFLVQFSWQPSTKGSGCPNSRSYALPFVVIDGVKNYISAHRDGKNTTYSFVDYKQFNMVNNSVIGGIDLKSTYGNRGSAATVQKIIFYSTKELMLKDYPSAKLGTHYNGCDNSGNGANP